MKRFLFITIFLFSAAAFGQQCVPSNTQSCTPNVQLATPFVNGPNWNVALVQNFTLLDQLLSGNSPLKINPYLTNNVINVDGCAGSVSPKYACSAAGIQAAITQAQVSVPFCGSVFIPPATIAMGSTQITIPPCIKVSGAGMKQTVLQWTSNLVSGAIGLTSPNQSYLGNLGLSFNSGNTSDAIRITGSDAAAAIDSTFEHIMCDFGTLGAVGSSCIHATSFGPSFTDVDLNHFIDINVHTADQAVVCQGCEGNHWDVTAQNMGAQIGSILFNEQSPNNNEIGDIRMESGTGNFANEICLQVAGSNNQFRLTCDGNLTGITAVNDLGSYNRFDVGAIGSPTLGSIASTSQDCFVGSSIGQSNCSFPGATIGQLNVTTQLGLANLLLSRTAPTISGFGTSPSIVFSNGTAELEINVGTGGTATTGTLTLPAAANGWDCRAQDMNTNIVTRETAFSTTSVSLTAASAWTASDKLLVHCGAF